MAESAREAYLATVDPDFAPAVRALDAAIVGVRDDFDSRVAYGILMYALGGDFRHWVVAIDCGRPGSPKREVHVRFLHGTMLSDPRGLLRAGTGILSTLDFPTLDAVDAGLVVEYLAEAVARHDEFKAEAAAH